MATWSLHLIKLNKHSLCSPSPEICVTQKRHTGGLRVSQEGTRGSFPPPGYSEVFVLTGTTADTENSHVLIYTCTVVLPHWEWKKKQQIPLAARGSSSSHLTLDVHKTVIWVMLWSLYNQWKEREAPGVRFIPSSCRSQKLVRWDTP